MNIEQKKLLQNAVENYIQEHGISQNELAAKSGVNARYIINIRKGVFNIKIGDKTTDIADKWLNRLAATVGLSTEKQYWQTVQTEQMKGIIAALKDAKDTGEASIITGETGCGKTFIAKLFASKHPSDVFIVTVGASDNLGDVLEKVIEALHLENVRSNKSAKIRAIGNRLRNMSEEGKEPVLIFDEAEYMKQPALCAIKELYDALNTWCALVLIGTEQLLVNIEKLRRKNRAGIPQLFRRIKYRIRQLPGIDKSFTAFLNGYETPLKKWLQSHCDNYGELHDVLVPVMREAERTGRKPDVEFVKMVLGI